MPNVLVLSLEGFSFSSRQLYEHLLSKLLSRASVHESISVQDALHNIHAGWPSIILVTDSVIIEERPESRELLDAVVDSTKHGCTTVLMGFFAEAVDHDILNAVFKEMLDLRWRVAGESKGSTKLIMTDEAMMRTRSLVTSFHANGLFLNRVPTAQTVYGMSTSTAFNAHAAFARVGLGKLGFIGDINFGEEPERLILAMCHLDRSEDSLEEMDGEDAICPDSEDAIEPSWD